MKVEVFHASLSVILCARHNRREGAYYADRSKKIAREVAKLPSIPKELV